MLARNQHDRYRSKANRPDVMLSSSHESPRRVPNYFCFPFLRFRWRLDWQYDSQHPATAVFPLRATAGANVYTRPAPPRSYEALIGHLSVWFYASRGQTIEVRKFAGAPSG